ncbi:unnamed protein product [Fraxinus pennsylvanica]|uniref:Uncharacterized protein n=1 Tax=Fraxinus pennsylvanica TaxID=56036 RepID=A0AAD2DWI2_9LAMI|nr:unnamed protein product [Fraxinus pennsylvanica]
MESAWPSPGSQSSSLCWFQEGLARYREKLMYWSKHNAGVARKELKVNLKKLQSLQSINQGDLNGRIKDTQKQIDVLLEDEEIKWKQRSKQLWLKCGDKNTAYFHKCASQRKKQNFIRSVLNESGELSNKQDEISSTFQLFYQQLFSTSNPTGIEEVVKDLEAIVPPDTNDQLQKPCTEEEVKRAMFDMDPMSSPGPDGFSADQQGLRPRPMPKPLKIEDKNLKEEAETHLDGSKFNSRICGQIEKLVLCKRYREALELFEILECEDDNDVYCSTYDALDTRDDDSIFSWVGTHFSWTTIACLHYEDGPI